MIKLKKLLKETSKRLDEADKLPRNVDTQITKVLKANGVKEYEVDAGKEYNETTDDFIIKMFDVSASQLEKIETDLKRGGVNVISSNINMGDIGIITFDI